MVYYRASKLLNILQKEELETLRAGRVYPELRSGDAISIEQLPYATAKEPEVYKGVIIGITRRKSDSMIITLNVSV